jgi:hypothetical protein
MVFDDDHTLTVQMISGQAPTSALSDFEVLNGANVALLGQEIIQFRDVTDLGNNVFRLSRLLRGRLGTELFMNSHAIGEQFVILDSDTVRRATMAATDLNVSRSYKVVGAGLSAFNAPITTAINTGVSQKPWQPIRIEGTRDGSLNLDMTWVRRTRIEGEWLCFIEVPLGEGSEQYEVDILTGSGTPTASSPFLVTSPAFQYTAAQQVTDFGVEQPVVSVAIYQLSHSVGRGYPGRALL